MGVFGPKAHWLGGSAMTVDFMDILVDGACPWLAGTALGILMCGAGPQCDWLLSYRCAGACLWEWEML